MATQPGAFAVDDPKILAAFLEHLPQRQKNYERGCIPSDNKDEEDGDVRKQASASAGVEPADDTQDPPVGTPQHDSHVNSAAATPPEGHRAPPPTPDSVAVAIERESKHLEVIPEDVKLSFDSAETTEQQTIEEAHEEDSAPSNSAKEVSNEDRPLEAILSPTTATISAFDAFTEKGGNVGLKASKFAGIGRVRSSVAPRSVLSTKDSNIPAPRSPVTPSRQFAMPDKVGEAYQDSVVEQFRKQQEEKLESRSMIFKKSTTAKTDSEPRKVTFNVDAAKQALVQKVDIDTMNSSSPDEKQADDPGSADPSDDHSKPEQNTANSVNTTKENMPPFAPAVKKEDARPKFDVSSTPPESPAAFEPLPLGLFKKHGLNFDRAAAIKTTESSTVIAKNDTENSSDNGFQPAEKLAESVITPEDGQDRDNASFFTSWGAPAARSGPKAEKRRVIISGLPGLIDDCALAGLIHEGPLETYRVNKPSEGSAALVSAIVTFTTGDSAQAFYNKYPNGLIVRMSGKKYVATVQMGENVDVISDKFPQPGVMKRYLEVGATRVVRATGADEDWTPRALRKMAEGRGRKLEAIADLYQNDARTIDFRFTNIADAVAFRGLLTRDHEWEDCTITFAEDPCAKPAASTGA
ncbi:uncharacterized protein AB675_3855 [Cyphellophora attinorum]|uniref:RRM domain-containing protein n=1 Tax=Cyphellophora attinorum TaxID=1664694 RepID=A0A0N0NI25_9EURO|nr:uncharacterized protein AB675_3855 [Phialophora attinorum]KPI34949.1 hypothetical protein AB675_3855 [Phialophora attinorum]